MVFFDVAEVMNMLNWTTSILHKILRYSNCFMHHNVKNTGNKCFDCLGHLLRKEETWIYGTLLVMLQAAACA